MEREKISIRIGTPVAVKLNGVAPRETSGINGPQWQYVVNDGNGIMWIDPLAHHLIQKSGAGNGDTVNITKLRNGEWDVSPARAPRSAELQQTNQASNHTPVQTSAAAAPRSAEQQQTMRPGSEMVAGYLYCAIDATIAASNYAKEKYGVVLQFDAEQIRTLAVTLLINGSKEGR